MFRALKNVLLTGILSLHLFPAVMSAQIGNAFGSLQDNIKFERIGREQGMRGSNINCILEDHLGFIWFGTFKGLHKYNGYGFTVYNYDVRDTTSISSDDIISLYEDRSGTLWVGTLIHGFNKFDRATGKFTHFLQNPQTSQKQIYFFYEDRYGILWIATSNGLTRYDRNQGRFTHYVPDPDIPEGLSHGNVHSVIEDRYGTLWIGTWRGLNRYDRQQDRIFHYVQDPDDPYSVSNINIRSMYEDHSGTLWIGSRWGGLHRYDREQDRFTRFLHDPNDPHSLSNNVVWAIHEDRSGTFWVGTEDGLNILDRAGGKFTRILHDPQDSNSLSSNDVSAIMEDRTGALWVGTGSLWGGGSRSGEYGLNRYDRGQNQFRHIIPDPANPASARNFGVNIIIAEPPGALWIASWGSGLYHLNLTTGKIRRYVNDPNNPHSLSQNYFMAACVDRNGTLWLGTADTGINRFDREKETFTQFAHNPADPHSLSHNRVSWLYEDREGTFWVSTFGGGINHFDRERGTFTRLNYELSDPTKLTNVAGKGYEDRDGIIWIGTWGGGLLRYDPASKHFTRYAHDPQDPHSLSNNIVRGIYEDHTGTLWVATNGGLNKLDRATGQFFVYTESDGLPENRVRAILEDDHGRLWVSSINGLSRFDPLKETFKNYTVDDGLQNSDYSYPGACRVESGVMFFGGANGIDFFHPDSIKDNTYIPPVFITRFTYYTQREGGEKAIIDEQISQDDYIELFYEDRNFAVEFAALNFRKPDKNQYAYRLEGAQNEWVYLGNQRSITFTNLAPGTYNLRVKGSNNDGVWNEEGASLKITIKPPWWRTGWAYAFYTLFALGLLYGARRFELNRQRLKHDLELEHIEAEKLQEMDRLKSRFFASISHEFRTPLTLISGPVKQLISGEFKGDISEQYHLILRNCNRLLRLVNQLLDLSKLESGKMILQASPQDIVALTRQLTMAFESLAGVRGIKLQFTGPDEPVMIYLEREHYEKIITNLLFNALKFTPEGGSVIVDCSISDFGFGIADLKDRSQIRNPQSAISDSQTRRKYVEIRVSDTGIGISASDLPHIFDRFYQAGDSYAKDAQGSGIGLALVKELVELHYGEISVESEVGKGSTFTVRLPLGKEHLRAEEIVVGEITVGAKHPSQKVEMYIEEFSRDASPQHPHTPPNKQTPTTNEIVLIVEDNPDMRAYIRGYLSEFYRLVEAEDGAQGIKQALKHAPDLIISDVMMPNMDGFQFCEKIKTDERTSHIPVILLTARASGESKIEGLETGADDYLTKPFDAIELRVRANNLIGQRRRLRERFRRELVIQPSEITVTSMDEAFLKKVMAAVEAHIDDPAFETDDLAREAGVSRRHLNRKLRALTGQSVREFIRTLRLKRAAQLLQQQSGTVTEIAYEVGFQSIAHFAKIFREEFGVAPSDFSKKG